MASDLSERTPSCPECGAWRKWEFPDRCWLCGYHYARLAAGQLETKSSDVRTIELLDTDIPPGRAEGKTGTEDDRLAWLPAAGFLSLVAVLAILAGIVREAPRVSFVLLGIVIGTAWVSTFWRAESRRRQGLPVTDGETLSWFVGSLLKTLAVIVGLAVVAILAFVVLLSIVCGPFLRQVMVLGK